MWLNLKKILFVSLLIFLVRAEATIEEQFNHIKQDPNALYTFFKNMPKGGELHYHLAGGVYAETLIALATNSNICLNPDTKQAFFNENSCPNLTLNSVQKNPQLYDEVVRAWSFKDFIPNGESRTQHFFATFDKFIAWESSIRAPALAVSMQRAADQNELYLEILILPDKAKSASFGAKIHNTKDFAAKRNLLLNDPLYKQNVQASVDEAHTILAQAKKILGCKRIPYEGYTPDNKVCDLTVKFQYYVLREQDPDSFFAQALNAFLASQQSKDIVGVNLVQNESSNTSLVNYRYQMQVFDFLHKIYPNVNIALHAGELNPQSVTPENLRFHIHDAIFTGHAQRIGHGITIAYEDNALETLKYMAKTPIPVEINLTSNKLILNVKGKYHPINYYLEHQVPIVLSSDDEGVLRTDLTREYVAATINHQIDYRTIKQINRNTLTYSFLPGKSLWKDPRLNIKVSECTNLNSTSCQNFIKENQKARLQWQLEQDLLNFEKHPTL